MQQQSTRLQAIQTTITKRQTINVIDSLSHTLDITRSCSAHHISPSDLLTAISTHSLQDRYTAAIQACAELLALQTIAIADASDNDKLRIQARQWLAERILPHRYGSKVQHTIQADNATLRGRLNQARARVGGTPKVVDDN